MHWRGTEEEWLGDWLLRAGQGFTGRANSALPLGDPGLPLDDALAKLTGWYRDRGLTPMIAVPMTADASSSFDNHLSERSWQTRPGPAYVMTADLAQVAAPRELPQHLEFRVDREPDGEWQRAYHYRGQSDLPPAGLAILMSAEHQAFASIRSRDTGEVLAIGRLSVAAGWAGITAVEVDARQRRRGFGGAITLGICAEAFARGTDRAFLQVEAGNDPAIALYDRHGFRYSHRYHYRVAPE